MADKSLGQHWLFDKDVLSYIANAANIDSVDTVLEIGPGLGTLTEVLLRLDKKVIAVELDTRLITDLRDKFIGQELTIVQEDIRTFDLSKLTQPYVIAANIPYYLTSHLMQLLTKTSSKPLRAVLLVQKEVAERVAAKPGQLSILGVSMQLYADVQLGRVVSAGLFSPPPKVDSQVVIINFYQDMPYGNPEQVMRVVKAGFSAPRKKLRSSLAGGLGISPHTADKLLLSAGIDPSRRPQTLSIEEWVVLHVVVQKNT